MTVYYFIMYNYVYKTSAIHVQELGTSFQHIYLSCLINTAL